MFYFRLIRPINLGIMALTMILFMAKASGYTWKYIDFPEAITAILSVVLVAAAGYVINDYFDRKVDVINKPEKTFIGNQISEKNAIWFYIGIETSALLFAFFTHRNLGYLSIAVSILLFFYSYDLKGRYLMGNLMISFLSALVIFTASHGVHMKFQGFFFEFAAMAFLITLAREVVKTAEDVEGDQAAGMQTAAIAWGIHTVKWIAFLCLALVAILVMWLQSEFGYPGTLYYALFGILIPMTFALIFLYLAKNKRQFHFVSTMLKIVMVSGLILVLWLKNFKA